MVPGEKLLKVSAVVQPYQRVHHASLPECAFGALGLLGRCLIRSSFDRFGLIAKDEIKLVRISGAVTSGFPAVAACRASFIALDGLLENSFYIHRGSVRTLMRRVLHS